MTASRPLVQKVDCIRLSVPDLEAGLRFYRDHLGHEIIWRSEAALGLRLRVQHQVIHPAAPARHRRRDRSAH